MKLGVGLPVGESHAHYLRVGRWSRCYHCGCVFAYSIYGHYCGAPWQTPELGFVVGEGLDEIPPEWVEKLAGAGADLLPAAARRILATATECAERYPNDPGVWRISTDSLDMLKEALR